MPDRHLVLEAAGGTAVVGEDRHPVGIRVGIDQLHRLLVAADPHRGQHRTEDLVAVDGSSPGSHRRRGSGPTKKPSCSAESLRPSATSVAPSSTPASMYPTTSVAVLGRHQWAHLGAGLVPGCGADGMEPLLHLGEELVAGGSRRQPTPRSPCTAPPPTRRRLRPRRRRPGPCRRRAAPPCGSSPHPAPGPACRSPPPSRRCSGRSGSSRRTRRRRCRGARGSDRRRPCPR